MKRTLPYILFLLSFVGFSQEDSPVSVSLDTARIRLGEPVEYTISVEGIRNVGFPKLERLGALELLSSKKADTFSDRLEKKYLLTGFDSGSFYRPKTASFSPRQSLFYRFPFGPSGNGSCGHAQAKTICQQANCRGALGF